MTVKVKLDENSPIGPKGAKVNIEVQKDNNDDFDNRSFYNAAAIVLNGTPKGTKKFRDVPKVVEIFISTFDMFGEGEMVYEMERVIKKSGTVRRNPLTEIFVNTKIED